MATTARLVRAIDPAVPRRPRRRVRVVCMSILRSLWVWADGHTIGRTGETCV
jgi:hypothetical protein